MKGCLLLLLLFYCSIRATAQPGTLDPSFGKAGFLLTKIPGSSETHFEKSVMQKDGKIVAIGWVALPSQNKLNYDIIIVRFNTDGTLDASFGSKGVVTTDFSEKGDFGYCVAIQNDGKILVGGRTQELDGTASSILLVRYHADGRLDHSFGKKGKTITALTQDSQIKKIVLQSDGKIIVVGFTQDFLLIRYHRNGVIDPSFGKKGIVLTDFNSGYDVAVTAAIQSNGKIVVAGNVDDYISISRYHSNGSLDKSFGNQGSVKTKFRNDFLQLSDMVLQGNAIIVAGSVYKSITEINDYDFLLIRYTHTGAVDKTFGKNGVVMTDFGQQNDEAIISMAIQNNEKIVVGGGISLNKSGSIAGFALARYNLDGSLDVSFGKAGMVKSNFGASSEKGNYNYINAINLMNGRLYCVGIHKLSAENKTSSSTQGIIAAYILDNKSLSCKPNRTVTTDKGMCSAIVGGIDPVIAASANKASVRFIMTGATTAKGSGSVSGKRFNRGVTAVTYKLANDQSCSFLVTVEDKEAPRVTNLSASPTVLRPSANKLQMVTVNYWLKDNCSAGAKLTVKSHANNKGDWVVVDSHHVRFKAKHPGQTYTIIVTTTDRAGNKSSKEVKVKVSNKKGKK